jgi:hypothetical protein
LIAARRLERLDDLLLGDLLGAGLDHHEAVGAARDDEIDQFLLCAARTWD